MIDQAVRNETGSAEPSVDGPDVMLTTRSDTGRQVRIWLTPGEAVALSRALVGAAAEALGVSV